MSNYNNHYYYIRRLIKISKALLGLVYLVLKILDLLKKK